MDTRHRLGKHWSWDPKTGRLNLHLKLISDCNKEVSHGTVLCSSVAVGIQLSTHLRECMNQWAHGQGRDKTESILLTIWKWKRWCITCNSFYGSSPVSPGLRSFTLYCGQKWLSLLSVVSHSRKRRIPTRKPLNWPFLPPCRPSAE